MNAREYYRIITFGGAPWLAYPKMGVPASVWNLRFPYRGSKWIRRFIRWAIQVHLDCLFAKKAVFPLEGNGFRSDEFVANITKYYSNSNVGVAITWPSPVRSTGRAYGYVFDFQNKMIIGFIKFAYTTADVEHLQSEVSALNWLKGRGCLPFDIPFVSKYEELNFGCAYAIFQPMPEKTTAVKWDRSSWRDWLKVLKDSFSEGTNRFLTFKQVLAIRWVQKFRAEADLDALRIFDAAVSGGMEVCATHGDFAQHNFREFHSRKWIFDWESFTLEGPVLADELTVYVNQRRFAESCHYSDLLSELIKDFPPMVNEIANKIIAACAFVVANKMSYHEDFLKVLRAYGDCEREKESLVR